MLPLFDSWLDTRYVYFHGCMKGRKIATEFYWNTKGEKGSISLYVHWGLPARVNLLLIAGIV